MIYIYVTVWLAIGLWGCAVGNKIFWMQFNAPVEPLMLAAGSLLGPFNLIAALIFSFLEGGRGRADWRFKTK